jgi:RNA polymerase sigma-70 factor (ECF subfamily)
MEALSVSFRAQDLEVPPGSAAAAAAPTREGQLLAAIARGDRRSFEQLYALYAPRVFRFAYRMIRDESKAEEVTNDVMLEVWKAAAQFGGRSSPSTWIFGIARHRTLNAVRGRTLHLTDIEEAAEVADATPSPEARVDGGRIGEQLQLALERLSVEHREVIELTFMEGKTYREIAAIARCPENTVKTRMFHAKKKLTPLLAAMLEDGALQ